MECVFFFSERGDRDGDCAEDVVAHDIINIKDFDIENIVRRGSAVEITICVEVGIITINFGHGTNSATLRNAFFRVIIFKGADGCSDARIRGTSQVGVGNITQRDELNDVVITGD